MCERWVGDWTELQHIDPPTLLGHSTGGLGSQPLLGHGSHSSIFSPTDLNFLSLGLYYNLTSTYFLRASQFTLNSARRQSRPSPDISNQKHLLFTQVHFSSDSPAGSEVNMQQQINKLNSPTQQQNKLEYLGRESNTHIFGWKKQTSTKC